MAKVSNPLIGKTSGSVGGTTFSSWKGLNIIKTKPTVVANPQSDKQKAQRAAFSLLVSLYRLLTSVISLGFKELAIQKSEFNAFMSYNVQNAFDLSVPPTATLEPENLLFSKGTIADTPITSVVASAAAHSAVFTYPITALDPGQAVTDKPLMVVYNETKNEYAGAVGVATRQAGTDTLAVPATWANLDVIHCYLSFVRADGSAASDSVYLAETIDA